MRFLIALFVMTLTAPNVFAESATDNTSQFFWQADSKESYLIPNLSYSESETKYKNAAPNRKFSMTALSLAYAYGLNDMFALSVSESFGLGNVNRGNTHTSAQGFGDLFFSLSGTKPTGTQTNFKFGATLSISPGASEFNSDGDQNRYSGRNVFTPYLGYEYRFGNMFTGVYAHYEMGLGNGTETDDDTATKFSGGNSLELAAFIETKYSVGKIGSSLRYTKKSNQNYSDGQSIKFANNEALHIYGTYDLNPKTTLLGSAGYDQGHSVLNVDSYSSWFVRLGSRFNF